MPTSRGATFWLGLLLVLGLFALPLLVGLNEPEMRNDEAIYSYAVERILDTGNWLTPRSIPNDGPFLEKPPLKFWITAAGIKSGLLPNNDKGLRWFDALFGGIAFVYIFLIGCRLSGPTCGVVAVLVLFTLDPLLFEHGLRSNNMEASLFLAYCGGLYHFIRWTESDPGRGRLHAFIIAGYFALAFMTKFVAALFLPMIAMVALLWRPGGWTMARRRWPEWVLPALGVIVVTAPWFIYQSRVHADEFWQTIFGVHVFKRFTAWLDPGHLHPWHFYFTQTWLEIGASHSQVLVGLGLVRLAVAAVRNESWVARLVLVWGLLPTALISAGTSKLLHYEYPFWPLVGLSAGFAFAWILAEVERHGPAISEWFARLRPRRAAVLSQRSHRVRAVLIGIASVAFALALWTAFVGAVRIEIGGTTIFRNSSFLRPAFVGAVLLWLVQQTRTVLRLVAAFGLALLLPLSTVHGQGASLRAA